MEPARFKFKRAHNARTARKVRAARGCMQLQHRAADREKNAGRPAPLLPAPTCFATCFTRLRPVPVATHCPPTLLTRRVEAAKG